MTDHQECHVLLEYQTWEGKLEVRSVTVPETAVRIRVKDKPWNYVVVFGYSWPGKNGPSVSMAAVPWEGDGLSGKAVYAGQGKVRVEDGELVFDLTNFGAYMADLGVDVVFWDEAAQGYTHPHAPVVSRSVA